MKIGIDTFGCDHGRSGLGSYIHSFASNITQSDEFETELFGSELDKFTYTSGKKIHYEAVQVADNAKAERLWHITKLKKFIKKQKYDALIFPLIDQCYPIKTKIPSFAIVNVVFSSLLKNKSWDEKHLLKKTLRNSTKIIAATKYIQEDLIKNGIKPEKISIIYNGIDHKLFYQRIDFNPEIEDVKPFAIKRPYFIYGSRVSGPEKKHIELIKAFELFKKNTGLPHRLVITGAESAYAEEVHKVIASSPNATDIFVTGYFPHENFPELYANAEACIFPATDEGVGLPVLEAMAAGIPVACTDKGALSEVNCNAYLKIEPDDVEQFSEALKQISVNQNLRKQLIESGSEWSDMFTWEISVNQTFELIKNSVKKNVK